jgi:hypothetical protein
MIKRGITIGLVITLGAIACFLIGGSLFRKGSRERILAGGGFHQVAHKGEGRAAIYKLLNGERELHLTDFKTEAGQALEVYLISAPDAYENETVERSKIVSLGALKAVEGDQSYILPNDADLSECRAVTIWSSKYRVNFTTAPLKPMTQEM